MTDISPERIANVVARLRDWDLNPTGIELDRAADALEAMGKRIAELEAGQRGGGLAGGDGQ